MKRIQSLWKKTMKKIFVTAAFGTLFSCFLTAQVTTPTNSVLYEYWSSNSANVSAIGDLTNPTTSVDVTTLKDLKVNADNYVARVSGYFFPQVSGEYLFHIQADDQAEFHLSTNHERENMQLIVIEPSCCTEQTSAFTVNLNANQNYYFEIYHKENSGGDYVTLRWTPPAGSKEDIPNSVMTKEPVLIADAKQIVNFEITGLLQETFTTIDEGAKTITIDVSNGTDVTSLVPVVETSFGATVQPASGVVQDFSSPVMYTVTADDATTADYTVTVNVLPLQTGNSVLSFSVNPLDQDAAIDDISKTITISFYDGYSTAQTIDFELSTYATASMESGSQIDITALPLIMTVTSQDGNPVNYTIQANVLSGKKGFTDSFVNAGNVGSGKMWYSTGTYAFTHDAVNEELDLSMTSANWQRLTLKLPDTLNLYGSPIVRLRARTNTLIPAQVMNLKLQDINGNKNTHWKNPDTKYSFKSMNTWEEIIIDFNGKLAYTESLDQIEIGEITALYFEMNDGQSNATFSFDDLRIGLDAIANKKPTINSVAKPDWVEVSAGEQTINLSGITDGNPNREESITITVKSSNQAVVPDGNISITYDGTSDNAVLKYTPALNGYTVLTVIVQDDRGEVYSDESDKDSIQIVAEFRDATPGVNDIATFGDPVYPNIVPGSGQHVIIIPQIDDGDPDEIQGLKFDITNNSPLLVTVDSFVYNRGESIALLYITELGQGGAPHINITLQDSVDIDAGGSNIFSYDMIIPVSAPDKQGVKYEATLVQQWQPMPYGAEPSTKPGYPIVWHESFINDHCKDDLFWGRMYGYIVPDVSGEYFFTVSSEGEGDAHLYLSSDADPENIPAQASPTAKNGSPSVGIELMAGKPYYFVSYHKEIINDYFLKVEWQGPGIPKEVISGNNVIYAIDLVIPSKPANLALKTKGTYSAIVEWDASTDNSKVIGYNVYVDGVKVNTELLEETEYTINNLDKNTQYSVVVTAVDDLNNYSHPSNVLTFTTHDLDGNPPSVPQNVTDILSTSFGIKIEWDESTDNETEVFGYNVYLDGADEPVNNKPLQSLEYLIRHLIFNTEYSIQVTALDASLNESAKSSPILASTTEYRWDDPDEIERTGLATVELTPVTKSVGFGVQVGYHLSGILVSNKVNYNSFESSHFKTNAQNGDLSKMNMSKSDGVGVNVDTETPYHGDKSAKLLVSDGERFELSASITMNPKYTYLVKFAAKKDASYSGNMDVQILKTTGGNVTAYTKSITGLTTDWQVFTFEFSGIENALKDWKVRFNFKSTGYVFIDEVEMHIKEWYDPNSKFTTKGIEILDELNPAGLRWGGIEANYEFFEHSVGPYQTDKMTLGDYAYLSSLYGGYPMLCVGVNDGYYKDSDGNEQFSASMITDYFSDKSTFADLMEYLGGDATSTWGSVRAAEGYTNSFIDDNEAIVIELGNEVWGSLTHGAKTFGENYSLYAEWCRDVSANYVKQSPFYNPDKVFVGASGRHPNNHWGHTELFTGTSYEYDWLNVSGYMGGNIGYDPEIDPGKSELDYHKNGIRDLQANLAGLNTIRKKMVQLSQRMYPMFMYEGNMTQDIYQGTLGQAITFADYYATVHNYGVALTDVFILEGGQWRLIEDQVSLSKRPLYHITSLYNHTAKGGVILKSSFKSVDKLVDGWGNEYNFAGVSVNAYNDGDKYTVVMFSRDFENDFITILDLPDTIGTFTNGKMYTLTGESYNKNSVTIDTADVVVTDSMLVTVPKYGMVVITFNAEDKQLEAPFGDVSYKKIEVVDAFSVDGTYTISEDGGRLHIDAVVSPEDALWARYEWSIVGDNLGAQIKPVAGKYYVYAGANGTITVRATAADGSGVYDEFEVTISGQTDVDENYLNNHISIYPNPAKDKLFIELNGLMDVYFELSNLQGQIIKQSFINDGETVDLSNLDAGIYITRFVMDNKTVTKRIIKE